MPKNFNYSPGSPVDLSGILASVDAANQAARTRVAGMQSAVDLFARGNDRRVQQREARLAREAQAKNQADYLAGQERLQEDRQIFEREGLEEQKRLSVAEMKTRAAVAMMQAGVDPRPIMQGLSRELESLFMPDGGRPTTEQDVLRRIVGESVSGARQAMGGLAGAAGGAMIGAGAPVVTPVAFQQQETGGFGNLDWSPPRSSKEIDLEEQEKVAEAGWLLNEYAMSPEGQKRLFIEVPTTRASAYGIDDSADPHEFERAVIERFPRVDPQLYQEKSLDGTVSKPDRTLLERQIKWLREKEPQYVLNGAHLAKLKRQALKSGFSMRHLETALEKFEEDYGRPALSMREAKALASESLRESIKAKKLEPSPISLSVQSPSTGDFFGALDDITDRELLEGATADIGGQTAKWTKGFAESLGLDTEQLGAELTSQFNSELEVGIAEDGRIGFLPPPDGTPLHPDTQRAFRELFSNPSLSRKLQAKLGIGPENKTTKTELDRGAAARGVRGKQGGNQNQPAPVEGDGRSDAVDESQSGGSSPERAFPPSHILDRYNDSIRGRKQKRLLRRSSNAPSGSSAIFDPRN